ncbi:hypothetical protein K435DRAFT_337095 [Dendrothele bispora CBS 962.96]|uniref:Uncharacterized protein n=1 Tax=Dendrothele bispora (strain CBS 962.96) TaxID=1314807 RepID=A0A4S8LFY5_DENBC|nr:hypothetical protein K435DRAFT_337095 [Dendrothele bispora CBS 962.96]
MAEGSSWSVQIYLSVVPYISALYPIIVILWVIRENAAHPDSINGEPSSLSQSLRFASAVRHAESENPSPTSITVPLSERSLSTNESVFDHGMYVNETSLENPFKDIEAGGADL